jgi:hypothetical protein
MSSQNPNHKQTTNKQKTNHKQTKNKKQKTLQRERRRAESGCIYHSPLRALANPPGKLAQKISFLLLPNPSPYHPWDLSP